VQLTKRCDRRRAATAKPGEERTFRLDRQPAKPAKAFSSEVVAGSRQENASKIRRREPEPELNDETLKR